MKCGPARLWTAWSGTIERGPPVLTQMTTLTPSQRDMLTTKTLGFAIIPIPTITRVRRKVYHRRHVHVPLLIELPNPPAIFPLTLSPTLPIPIHPPGSHPSSILVSVETLKIDHHDRPYQFTRPRNPTLTSPATRHQVRGPTIAHTVQIKLR